MAKLSSDGKSVTVEKGDTLWSIASTHLGAGSKYKQLAAINNISNPDLIRIGQVIKLSGSSSGSSSSSKSTNSKQAVVDNFGLQSDADNKLFATWTWSKQSQTESYKVSWNYATGDGVWFVGSETSITVDKDNYAASRQSLYDIPQNATKVRFRVKPISKTYKKGDKDTTYWTAEWSEAHIFYTKDLPPDEPATPTVTIEKYKLTAELNNLDLDATTIQFQVVKNDSSVFATGTASIKTGHASYSCTVDAGAEYKVRCRSCRDKLYSDWSGYSNNVGTIPSTPAKITICRASSETSVYLAWEPVKTADTYDIQYTTDKKYFESSDQTTITSGIEKAYYEKTGLETGQEYFFRIRAVNENGESGWSAISRVTVGKDPAPPTTWSSTTTAIVGEPLTLYWVHNAEDNSSQTYAQLELSDGEATIVENIKNTTDEDEKDKTSSYVVDTTPFANARKLQWRVRTAGITKVYGEWSILRTIDIYEPPTLELDVTDPKGKRIETLSSFPFYISALAGPISQTPIGYHLSIISNEIYETVDDIGNSKIVNKGEQVYHKYFDISNRLLVQMSAGNVDLENNITYTVNCVVTMDSGLTAESSSEFTVYWTDEVYIPNAEITLDADTLVTYIRPYCEEYTQTYYKVVNGSVTDEVIGSVYGEIVEGTTNTGEPLYYGTTDAGEDVYYCIVETSSMVEGVLLSVYRREFDGSFTELASEIDNVRNIHITDPHPALDYARYRIVATTQSTGAVGYYDVPGYPVDEHAVIIQWDDDWTNFDVSSEDALEQPPWAGSLLKIPYNIDVSNNNEKDVDLVAYIGRKHPVSYYGTQLGEKATWTMVVPKSDKETLYGLRRLAIWTGDVYVREPSGSGYWANISVSFSQKHTEVTIPVTLDVTRVEGGA